MFNVLFETVADIMDMPDADRLLCYQYFEPVFFPKNTIIESAGKIPQHQYFIVNGIMRNFYIDELGKEITTDMNNEPRFFTSYNHFANKTISNENIECITECSLLRIKRDNEDILYSESIILGKYTILLFQQIIEKEKKRINELSTLNAKERYLKFIGNNPNVLKCVPLQYIASYLGIKPETISRIRRDLIS
ncbi:Crp/Fnr family transcriptional regulator [Gillisia limnaea]|uniref:Putative transcriptional regulator, Crp/Fnr family n=2 Tax=Gillisia TaxID=244698 RepID=H2BQK1_GILLR|nr:putative transcriptional regulator, Crp/Fnr family [Gillisia limnaea DSM 15749]